MIVVNTCAFIDTAKEESIDAILEMAQLKSDGNCKRLVVTGCLAERYRDELKKEIPEIDAVLGTGEVARDRRRTRDRLGGPGCFSVPAPCRSRSIQKLRAACAALRYRAPELPTYLYDADDAAAADDAEALRLREGRRRLRLHLRVLHHPDAARQVPQPRRGVDRARGASAGRSAA